MEVKVIIKADDADKLERLFNFLKYSSVYEGYHCAGTVLGAGVAEIVIGSESIPYPLHEADITIAILEDVMEILIRTGQQVVRKKFNIPEVYEELARKIKKLKISQQDMSTVILAAYLDILALPKLNRESLIYGLRASLGKIGSEKLIRKVIQTAKELVR